MDKPSLDQEFYSKEQLIDELFDSLGYLERRFERAKSYRSKDRIGNDYKLINSCIYHLGRNSSEIDKQNADDQL